jgi:copper(I)-binding protein
MLHDNAMDGDVTRMTDMETIEVPAHGEVVLAPGGRHVMLTGLAEPLVLEDRFTLKLTFEHAGDVDVEVLVESLADHLTAPASGAAMGHAGHEHH